MKWNFGNMPLFRWDRNVIGAQLNGQGRQRNWFTNLDQLALFRWGPKGVGRSRGRWSVNQGNLPYFPWTRRSVQPATAVLAAAQVAGVITAAFTIPPGNSAAVAGLITLTVPHLSGTVTVHGSGAVAGNINATFAQPLTGSAQCAGRIDAIFFVNQGQDESCISGTESTPGTAPNAVH